MLINDVGVDVDTALVLAVKLKFVDVVTILLQTGVDIDLRLENGALRNRCGFRTK